MLPRLPSSSSHPSWTNQFFQSLPVSQVFQVCHHDPLCSMLTCIIPGPAACCSLPGSVFMREKWWFPQTHIWHDLWALPHSRPLSSALPLTQTHPALQLPAWRFSTASFCVWAHLLSVCWALPCIEFHFIDLRPFLPFAKTTLTSSSTKCLQIVLPHLE